MTIPTAPARTAGLVISLAVSFLMLTAFSGGIVTRTQKNGTGCICHGSAATGVVNVAILGPEALTVGQTGIYTVVISGGPLSGAGTNIAASSGALDLITGQGLQKLGDELTHTGPKVPQQGSVTFGFSYTAPLSPGTVTLYANGNSVDLSGDPSGDEWNFALNRSITVSPATSVPGDGVPPYFALEQNFPNPFNPTTTIEFTLPENAFTRLDVFAPSGERVRTLVAAELPAGVHRRQFDASGLASGVYICRLAAGTSRATRAMVLVR